MASGTREELWEMFALIFGPEPSPFVNPDDDTAYGESVYIPCLDSHAEPHAVNPEPREDRA